MDVSSTTLTSTSHQIAEDLFNARVSKGYTVDQLAIATGLTESDIRRVEEGRGNLSSSYIRRIRTALS